MARVLRIGHSLPGTYSLIAHAVAVGLSGQAVALEFNGVEEEYPTPYYNLYTTDTNSRGLVPFTVTWPTPPAGTLAELSVTDSGTLATALATPNARITVAAGSYGVLALTRNDQHWILHDDATFSGLTTASRRSRIVIEGGSFTSSSSFTILADDLWLDNVNFTATDSLAFGIGAFGGNPAQTCNRVAIVHCTSYSGRIGLYFAPGLPGNRHQDIILAGNYVSGGMTVGNSGVEPAFRIQGAERVILVDNRARCGIDGQGIKHTYRSHFGNQDFYMRRNMTEYGDGIYFRPRSDAVSGGVDDYMGDHWVYDYLFYSNSPAVPAYATRTDASSTTWPGVLVAVGGRAYQSTTNRWYWNSKTGDTVSDNTSSAYTAPPAMGAWLTARGIQPGADH